ncbi:hypothetical protein MTO96_034901 [Rhipicephalus appendiculatus]
MEILKKKRKVIRSQVTRFTNDADKILSSTSAVDLEEDHHIDRRSVICSVSSNLNYRAENAPRRTGRTTQAVSYLSDQTRRPGNGMMPAVHPRQHCMV